MGNIAALNPPRSDGFPKIKEFTTDRDSFKTDRKNPAYERPISELTREYVKDQTVHFNFKIHNHGESSKKGS